jgi:hypothetical protein
MAVGAGLTPDQRRLLLQALIQGGNSGMTDPAAALQGLLQAPGGQSAAQAIVAGLRNRLLPPSPSGVAAPSPAIQASRGSSPDEPTYAKPDATGILGEPPKPGPQKTDDVADLAKKLSDKAPEPPSKAAGGVLAMGPSQGPDPGVVSVPDVPDAATSVRRAVGQSALPNDQRDLMTRMVMMEAGNQSRLGKEAVAHVIMNRVADGRYGDGVQGVLTKKSQFEPWGNPSTRAQMLSTPTDSPRYQAAKDAVDRVLSGEAPDPTNGATHFLNKATSSSRGDSAMNAGGWGRTGRDQVTIGAHTFMKADAGRGPGPGPVGRQELATRETLARDLGGQTTPPDTTDQAAPAVSAAGKPIFDDLSSQDQADLGGGMDTPPEADLGPDFTDSGGGDIGGLLGGLGGGDGGEDNSPSQFSQDVAQEEKQPDKPILPAEDTKPGGILSGGGPLGEPDQSRVDLSRVFSPEGMGGAGLFGRDQGPDPSGFKAPVGLPAGGPSAAPLPTAGILGAPASGLAGITPPQLRSVAPGPPLPPPRPPGIDVNLGTPPQSLAPPDVQPGFSLPRRAGQPDAFGGGIPQPRAPTGILGSQPGPQLGAIGSPPAVDPDRFARDPLSPISPGLLGPSLPGPSLTGPGMGGANPPWQDPPKPQGILGPSSPASPLATPDDTFSRVSKNLGSLSGILGQASDQMGARKRLSSSPPSPSLISQASLLNGGLLSNARQGIDLNRFFGLLSGRVG